MDGIRVLLGSNITGTEPSNAIEASSIHIGFGWPVAVPLTLPFSSVAMRHGPVPADPAHSCVGAAAGAGRFAAVCCVRGGVFWPLQDIVSLRGFIAQSILFFANTPFIVQYIARYLPVIAPLRPQPTVLRCF